MKLKLIIRSFIILSVFVSFGCATIVSNSKYPVDVKTAPHNVNFTVYDVDGNFVAGGTTHEKVTLNSSSGFFQKAEYDFVFYKEGYNERKIHIKSSFDNWYIGNIFFPGILGLIIDPITGAMWELPEKVSVNLTKNE